MVHFFYFNSNMVKSLIVEQEIHGSIFAYTKNWLVFWSDDKELSLGADAIRWNSFKKRKRFKLQFLNKGSVWIELIFAETENWNWKYCSKIIFKCVNSAVEPIFNEKVVEKWNLWLRKQCTDALFTMQKSTNASWTKKKKKRKLQNKNANATIIWIQTGTKFRLRT